MSEEIAEQPAEALPDSSEAEEFTEQDYEESEGEEVEAEETEGEAEPDDEEEVDFEGKKYKVKKEIRDALLRQSDYTRKTQELAQHRQEIELQKQQAEQAIQYVSQFQAEIGELKSVENQIEMLKNLDWNAAITENPVETMKLQVKYNQLLDKRSELNYKINELHTNVEQERQKSLEIAAKKAVEILSKDPDLPGWSVDFYDSCRDQALKLGYTAQEFNSTVDAKAIKTLYLAKIGQETLNKLKAKPPAAKAPTKPTTVVKSGPTSQTNFDPDKLSPDKWLKWRNQQLAKKK